MKIALSPDPDRADILGPMIAEQERIAAETARPGARVVRLSDVEPERLSWLWQGRLPRGKQVVLDGDPSLGKSTLTIDFAARISTGTPWPDGSPCERGTVVLMSAEDGLADTIAPRLLAADGDPTRVVAITGIPYAETDTDGHPTGRIEWRPPSLPADLDHVRRVIVDTRATLLVVDVLMAYLGDRINAHRDQDVRRVLAQLADLADSTGCCVLLLRHLNKGGGGGSAMYRGGGSIGIIGAARAGYVVGADPDDDEGRRRVLACVKMNLGPEPDSLTYQLEGTETGVARVVWGEEPSKHRANDLLSPLDQDERSERDSAAEWLVDYLEQQGGVAAKADIEKAARSSGIARATLTRARSRAGVTYEANGFPRRSYWLLADLVGSQLAQLAQPSEPEPTEPTVSQQQEPPAAVDVPGSVCGANECSTRLRTSARREAGYCTLHDPARHA